MKKTVLVHGFLLLFFTSFAQNKAAEFETVLRSGNSAKAFQFVRNIFGVPEAKDPFLHFKGRGITQLISFYDHSERKIEATSLIRFDQTRAFWTNYSQQFTAGKWNYKNLYKNDSLAWLAANYSITLIYAHEMGHYMSYNLVNDFHEDYSCEELVANQCLAAFANAFNGNKTLEKHKQLFLSLARQTYALIPDSNKTGFTLPMENWCASNPMKDFFGHFETDQTRFLRMYGYSQFRMMEATLMNYNGDTWPAFLNKTFLANYNTYTGAEHFKPLRYKIVSQKDYKKAAAVTYYLSLSRKGPGNFFRSHFLNDYKYHFDPSGQLIYSIMIDEPFNYNDSIKNHDFTSYNLVNLKIMDTGSAVLHNWMFLDSLVNYHSPGRSLSTDLEILSAFQHDSNYYYLVREHKSLFTGLEIDTFFTRYEFVNLVRENNKYYTRRATLPDSLFNNGRMVYQEVFVAGINNGNPIIITNELTKEHDQVLSIYPVDTYSLHPGPPISQGSTGKKGYFNMLYPTLYLDTASGSLNLCFWNPVTSFIYLIRLTAAGTEAFQLYQNSSGGQHGPKMEVAGLRMAGPNKLWVFAKTRKPGNTTKAVMQKLVLQW